jgi:hypothetical protein
MMKMIFSTNLKQVILNLQILECVKVIRPKAASHIFRIRILIFGPLDYSNE